MIAVSVMQDLVEGLRTDIDIAVLDAANCTRARRRWIRQQVQEAGLYAQTIFIEAQCESQELIASNVHQTILRSPEVREGVLSVWVWWESGFFDRHHSGTYILNYARVCDPAEHSTGTSRRRRRRRTSSERTRTT